jgi:hypothetical protein
MKVRASFPRLVLSVHLGLGPESAKPLKHHLADLDDLHVRRNRLERGPSATVTHELAVTCPRHDREEALARLV